MCNFIYLRQPFNWGKVLSFQCVTIIQNPQYYDKGKFSCLGEETGYKGKVHILLIYSYEIVQFYFYVVHSDISFLTLQLLHMCVE
jgi:hypothetical protein